MSDRKRGRNDKDDFHRYGPAAAALRRGHVFRDAREAKEQVTVESILRDAVEMNRFHSSGTSSSSGMRAGTSGPEVLLNSREELALYRQKKREEMETKVVRGAKSIGNWVKYARWEAQQESYDRMRDVMERAVEVHGLDPHIWRDYAELEATHGFVEQARKVFQRGVKFLPAATDLWLKYALLEQAAGKGERAREVFLQWTHAKDSPPCAYELHVLHEVQMNNRREVINNKCPSPNSMALVVSQSRYAEGCRPILRQYVEAVNSTDAWLFYFTVEQIVLKDTNRAIKVLETALEVLPQDVLYGPIECRIPLTLADAYSNSNKIDAARELYKVLLSRVSDHEGAETVLRHYRSFERLHVESMEDGEYISFLEAKKRYEERLKMEQREEPYDYDTAFSLYVLLAGEIKRLNELSRRQASKATHSLEKEDEIHCQIEKLESQAFDVLQRAVMRFPSPSLLSSSQQHAILVSAFTKRVIRYVVEKKDCIISTERDFKSIADIAREVIARTIKQFPFDRASCSQLWRDAASLEEEVFALYTQARRLLSAGFQVTKDITLMDALIQFEERMYTKESAAIVREIEDAQRVAIDKGELTQKLFEVRNEYVRRIRTAFQSSIKAAPQEAERWHQYAKWEEHAGRLNGVNSVSQSTKSRPAMLYKSCIDVLSEEAQKCVTLDRRFTVLKQIDETWSRWMSMELRSVRRSLRGIERMRAKNENVSAETLEELACNADSLHRMCVSLLEEVAAAYRHEALSWSFAYRRNSGDGVLSSLPPTSLPKNLKPAVLRLAEACDVVVRCLWQTVAAAKWQSRALKEEVLHNDSDSFTRPGNSITPSHSQEEQGKELIREVFRSLIEKERRELFRALIAGTTSSFEETKIAKQWREALLGPLLAEWGRYEVAVGGSLAAVSAAAAAGSQTAPSNSSTNRRRTRLFKKGD